MELHLGVPGKLIAVRHRGVLGSLLGTLFCTVLGSVLLPASAASDADPAPGARFDAAAPGTVTAEGSVEPVRLRVRAAEAVDPATTIDAVCCGGAAARFGAEASASVRFGPAAPLQWLRPDRVEPGRIIRLSSVVDIAELYWRDRDGGPWQRSISGDHVPAATRSLPVPDMALPVPARADPGQLYLRIEQPSFVTIALDVYTPAGFDRFRAIDQSIKLFLLGFVAAIVGYNLVVSMLIRDPVFLLNAVTIAAMVAVAAYLSGYGAAYVWPLRPARGEQVMNLAIAVANAGGLLFIRRFLLVGAPAGRRHRLLLLPLPLLAIGWIAGLAGSYALGRHALLAVSCLTLVTLAAVLVRGAVAGDRQARIMSLPFTLGMLPGVVIAASYRLAGVDLGLLSHNALEAFLAAEALLFSFVIAARVHSAERARGTAAQELGAARRNATALILNAQDAERRRVAQDLHDSVGQRLLFLINALKVSALRVVKPPPPASDAGATTGIATAIEDATQVLDDLRRIARSMHPATLDHLGWRGAIQLLVDDVNRATDIACDVSFGEGDFSLGSEARLHLYRIVQECLNNVVRHARAGRCRIRCAHAGGNFTIRIDDDGVGALDADGGLRSMGLGFTSIDERVRILGGRWQIGVGELGGARIVVSVPAPEMPFATAASGARRPEPGAHRDGGRRAEEAADL